MKLKPWESGSCDPLSSAYKSLELIRELSDSPAEMVQLAQAWALIAMAEELKKLNSKWFWHTYEPQQMGPPGMQRCKPGEEGEP